MHSRRLSPSKVIAISIFLCGLVLSGCDNSNPSPNPSASPTPSSSPSGNAVGFQALAITPLTPVLVKGQTLQLAATGVLSTNLKEDLTSQVNWSVADPSIATISSSGLLTALADGSTSISASLSGAGALSASDNLQVTDGNLTALQLSPAMIQIPMGVTQQFKVTGTYQDQTSQSVSSDLSWTSSDPSIATVDQNGNVTPVQPGIVSIQATDSSSQISGSATLSVNQATLKGIVVSFTNSSVPAHLTSQAVATGSYSDGSSVNLTAQVQWTSSNSSVASISGQFASQGLVQTSMPGTTQITASFGGMSGSASFTVSSAVLSQIQITPSDVQLAMGVTQQYSAKGIYSDGTSQDITASINWSSSANAVALISASGLASPVAPGVATITAQDPATLVSASASLSVSLATLQGMSISVNPSALVAGNPAQADVVGSYSDGTSLDLSSSVVWSSSDSSIATISASGGQITTWAQGQTTITAQDPNSQMTQSYTLVVGAPVITNLQIKVAAEPLGWDLGPGGGGSGAGKFVIPEAIPGNNQQYEVSAVYSDGSSSDVSSQVTLTFSNPSLVSLVSGTTYTLLANGSETITASLPGTAVTGTYSFAITDGNIDDVEITVSDGSAVQSSYGPGSVVDLIVTVTYDDGTTANLTSEATWNVSMTDDITGELVEQNNLIGTSSSAYEELTVGGVNEYENIAISVTLPDGSNTSVSTQIGNPSWDIAKNGGS